MSLLKDREGSLPSRLLISLAGAQEGLAVWVEALERLMEGTKKILHSDHSVHAEVKKKERKKVQ